MSGPGKGIPGGADCGCGPVPAAGTARPGHSQDRSPAAGSQYKAREKFHVIYLALILSRVVCSGSMSDPDQGGGAWTLLTGHGHVLVEIARNPQARIRDISPVVGLTERSVQAIVADLEAGGTSPDPHRAARGVHREPGQRVPALRPGRTPDRPVPRPARRHRDHGHTRTRRRPRPGTGSAPDSTKVQQRPLTAACTSYRLRPALAGTADKRPAAPLVRDEEALKLQHVHFYAAA